MTDYLFQGVSQSYYDKNENVSEQIALTCTNEKKKKIKNVILLIIFQTLEFS